MRKILLILLIFSAIFAKEQQLSQIPPAQVFYIDLEPEFCDEKCLNELLQKEFFISFLTRFNSQKITNQTLLNTYNNLNKSLLIAVKSGNKIAVIIPLKIIKSYSHIVAKSLMAYALRSDSKIALKFINSDDESSFNLQKALDNARNTGISTFIAVLTINGANTISSLLKDDETLYLPTISRADFANKNLIFGGVDYGLQIEKLITYANDKISAFSDGSVVGRTLNQKIKDISDSEIFEVEMSVKDVNLKSYFTKFSKINNSSIFLNLPLIKATLIATQLKTFQITPFALLSTQINYDPKFISLVKQKDRQNLYLANSINNDDSEIFAKTALLDLDMRFNHISYSCAVGFDYLQSLMDTQKERIFNKNITENQIIYQTEILKTDKHGFVKINE